MKVGVGELELNFNLLCTVQVASKFNEFAPIVHPSIIDHAAFGEPMCDWPWALAVLCLCLFIFSCCLCECHCPGQNNFVMGAKRVFSHLIDEGGSVMKSWGKASDSECGMCQSVHLASMLKAEVEHAVNACCSEWIFGQLHPTQHVQRSGLISALHDCHQQVATWTSVSQSLQVDVPQHHHWHSRKASHIMTVTCHFAWLANGPMVQATVDLSEEQAAAANGASLRLDTSAFQPFEKNIDDVRLLDLRRLLKRSTWPSVNAQGAMELPANMHFAAHVKEHPAGWAAAKRAWTLGSKDWFAGPGLGAGV